MLFLLILISCAGNTNSAERPDAPRRPAATGRPAAAGSLDTHEGKAVNPSEIGLPARLKISGDIWTSDLIDKGSCKINVFDVIPRLEAFTGRFIAGGDFDITGATAFGGREAPEGQAAPEGREAPESHATSEGREALEKETGRIKAESSCIFIAFQTSETYLEIHSEDGVQGFAKAGGILIADEKDRPSFYKIITDSMIFEVKAGEEFDRQFKELFLLNASVSHSLTSEEIKSFSDGKKPDFMKFVSKNLGLKSVELRDDYTLETKELKLENGEMYTLLIFSDAYITRLLVFRSEGEGKTGSFAGNVDVRSWGDHDGIEIRKIAGKTFFVARKNLRGHGTGILVYSQDWYRIDGGGIKKVLSIPYLHEEAETYGFSLELKSLDVKGADMQSRDLGTQSPGTSGPAKPGGAGLKLAAGYKLTRLYKMSIPAADENGYVKIDADISAEFPWDKNLGIFTSEYDFDGDGVYDLVSGSDEIKKKCTAILEKYYAQLESAISSIPTEPNDANRWKAEPYKAFLGDCYPGEKTDNLKKKLPPVYR